MTYTFICYSKCSTCSKARKWLQAQGIDFKERDIKEDNPTAKELAKWIPASGLEAKKFFNTSGKAYREANLKDLLKTMSEEEQIRRLAADGMLVKRPILVGAETVLAGFKEEDWAAALGQQGG